MQYELRTQVIEPTRKTFDNLVKRYGDRPASRYEEGTIDVQPKENFHYRPLWDPSKEIYDPSFSTFRLTDEYSFTDPRQFYYAPYVTSRATMAEQFGTTLDYVENRDLLGRLDPRWRELMASLLVPLRHYESGAQLISVNVARFGFGTTITQCAAYAGFDRIGNAQMISRTGIVLGGGTAELLGEAKQSWVDDEALQPLRKHMEQMIAERDWGVGLVRLDVTDQLLYAMFFGALDDAAIVGGAPAYSLLAQHHSGWMKDQRKWVDALYAAWTKDPELAETNTRLLATTANDAIDAALEALRPVAAKADELVGGGCVEALDAKAAELREQLVGAATDTANA